MASIRAIPINDVKKSIQTVVPELISDICGLITDKLILPEDYVAKLIYADEVKAVKRPDDFNASETPIKIADYVYELLQMNEHNRVAFALEKLSVKQKNQLLNTWRNMGDKSLTSVLIFYYYAPTHEWSLNEREWLKVYVDNEIKKVTGSNVPPHLLNALRMKLFFSGVGELPDNATIKTGKFHVNYSDEHFLEAVTFHGYTDDLTEANLRRTDWGDQFCDLVFRQCDLADASFSNRIGDAYYSQIRFVNSSLGNGIFATGNVGHAKNLFEFSIYEPIAIGRNYCNPIIYFSNDNRKAIIDIVKKNRNPIFMPFVIDIFAREKMCGVTLFSPAPEMHRYSVACYLMGASNLNDFNERVSRIPLKIISSLSTDSLNYNNVLNMVRLKLQKLEQGSDVKAVPLAVGK